MLARAPQRRSRPPVWRIDIAGIVARDTGGADSPPASVDLNLELTYGKAAKESGGIRCQEIDHSKIGRQVRSRETACKAAPEREVRRIQIPAGEIDRRKSTGRRKVTGTASAGRGPAPASGSGLGHSASRLRAGKFSLACVLPGGKKTRTRRPSAVGGNDSCGGTASGNSRCGNFVH